ncbi:MAG: 50S ribosomal protein L29 [Nannocystis sp.]|jgi:large subunit ribosomal protein L29|nr:50S ribosomal protein L29 [Nannocystis sp.]
MKATEIRERSDADLNALEIQLREQLLRLNVAKATQRAHDTARFGRIRRDIARIKTIQRERKLGIGAERVSQEAQS